MAALAVTEYDGGLLLEWYDFGPTEWSHVSRGVVQFVRGTVLPVGGFYVMYRLVNFELAVLLVLSWCGCIFSWRLRELDIFSLITVVLACVKATAGLVSGDVRLYLAWPSLENLSRTHDTVIGWPLYVGLIWFTGWYPLRLLRQYGQVLP